MRNEIRQALQDCQNRFGKEYFEDAANFTAKMTKALPNVLAEPVYILLNSAISGMNAYSRIKNSSSRNMNTDVRNLTRELRKKYFIEESAAKATIECIAELLGFIPPTCDEPPPPAFTNISIGEIVQFGDFCWRVLDVENGKALVISDDILEQRAYHPCYEGVIWENSKLRQYLNGDFYNNFSQSEKDIVVETRLENPDNQWYGISGGNDTYDKIFVLSLEEVDRYFGNSGDYLHNRRKKYEEGKWVADDSGWILSNLHDDSRVAKHNGLASLWWLRTPGYSDCTVAYVGTPGYIPTNGDRVCIGRGGVRPALWVKAGLKEEI